MNENRNNTMSDRFAEALLYAGRLHADQRRKTNQTPYIAHLLAVTALVMEAGGDEDTTIAALLHDAVEDQGGMETLEKIKQRFGNKVAHFVEECTDAFTHPKPPWRERKHAHIERIKNCSSEALLVILADKVHNARTMLADYDNQGESIWDKFKGGREGTLWYYQSLLLIFKERTRGYLVNELVRLVDEVSRTDG